MAFRFLQRLSAFFNGFPIFLNGFLIFLNGFPLSEKTKKIYLRRQVYKRSPFELRISCHLLPKLCNRHSLPKLCNRHLLPELRNCHLLPELCNRHLLPELRNCHSLPELCNCYNACISPNKPILALPILQRISCLYYKDLSLWHIPQLWDYPGHIWKCSCSLFYGEEELFSLSSGVLAILAAGVRPHGPWQKR